MPEEQKTTKISIKEFKMWLQGVEEMQEEGWFPNLVQWKKIREKLDQVVDVEMGKVAAGPLIRSEAQPPVRPVGPAVPAGPSLLTPTPAMPLPPQTTMTAGGLPVSLSSGSVVPTKTPDIDTTNGNYKSQFA